MSDSIKTVYVTAPNVWTSKGKFLEGQPVDLTADEIKELGKKVTSKKPKADV